MEGQGMAWILLLTYTLLLVYNVGFCYYGFVMTSEGGSNSTNLTTEAAATTTTQTTTPFSVQPDVHTTRYPETTTGYNDSYNGDYTNHSDRFKRYVDDEIPNGPDACDYSDRPETYVYLPCGASGIVTLLIILGGISSRAIFRSTMPTHASILTVVLHLATLIIVLYRKNLIDNIWVIVGGNIGAVILNGLQVLLDVLYLRSENIPIATFNFDEQLSFNSFFFIARTVMSAFALNSFIESDFWTGSSTDYCTEEPCEITEYGISSAFYCATAALVGVILNAKKLMSYDLGSFHFPLATGVTFVQVCAYAAMCILVSPLYTSGAYSTQFSSDPLNYAIACVVLHAVHFVLLLTSRTRLSTNVLDYAAIVVSHAQDKPTISNFFRRISQAEEPRPTTKSFFWYNTALSILAVISLVLSAISLADYGGWPNALILAVSATLFSRTSVMALSEVLTVLPDPTTTLQKLLFLVLEGTVTLVALIASCFTNKGMSIAAAAIMLIAYVILAIYVATSHFMKTLLEKLLPSEPLLQTTLIEEDIPSGSRPHQTEVDLGGDDNANVVVNPEAE